MESLIYELWLSDALQGDGTKCAALKERFGSAADIFLQRADVREGLSPGDRRRMLDNKILKQAEKNFNVCTKKNIDIIIAGTPRYPALLSEIHSNPQILFCRGSLPDLDKKLCIACVGTRLSTSYGNRIMEKLARELALAGVVVVSGMASGIDAAAHKGALKGEGETVAVLGTAIDDIYPRENRSLYKFIMESGAVISEHPPGAKTYPSDFPKRNRTISGLSMGVLVVEAPFKSGALITVNHALSQNRDVFTVPCNIDNLAGAGSNALIKAGAKPVFGVNDILEEYLLNYPERLTGAGSVIEEALKKEMPPQKADKKPPREDQNDIRAELSLSEEQRIVKEHINDTPVTIEQLMRLTGLPVEKVTAAAVMLEIYGHVVPKPGGRYARR